MLIFVCKQTHGRKYLNHNVTDKKGFGAVLYIYIFEELGISFTVNF